MASRKSIVICCSILLAYSGLTKKAFAAEELPCLEILSSLSDRQQEAISATKGLVEKSIEVSRPSHWERLPPGCVLVGFSIDGDGLVLNPMIIDSTPPNVFDRAAQRTIVKFQFKAGNPLDEALLFLVFDWTREE